MCFFLCLQTFYHIERPLSLLDIGNICIPLEISSIDSFDPSNTVTVGSLLLELDQSATAASFAVNSMAANGITPGMEEGWERTSLKPYVDYFKKHCDGIMRDATAIKRGNLLSRIVVASYCIFLGTDPTPL